MSLTPFFPSRYATAGRDAVKLVVLSLDLATNATPILFATDALPFDAYRLLPLPKPVGGVLIVCVNALVYVDQGMPGGYGLAVNPFAASTTAPHFPLGRWRVAIVSPPSLPHVIPECVCRYTARPEYNARCGDVSAPVGSSDARHVKNGRNVRPVAPPDARASHPCTRPRYHLHLQREGRTVTKLAFRRAGATVVPPSCGVVLADTPHLLLGSRLGDALLLHYEPTHSPMAFHDHDQGDVGYDDDDDDDLFSSDPMVTQASSRLGRGGGASALPAASTPAYRYRVCDSLVNVGPVRDIAVGKPAPLREPYTTLKETVRRLPPCLVPPRMGFIHVCVCRR